MSVLSRDELLEKTRALLGDRTDDEAIAFIEDVTDTYDDIVGAKSGYTEEEVTAKVNEVEEKWRKKYRDRFFGNGGNDDDDDDDEPDGGNTNTEEVTIDDLFEKKEGN